MAERNEQVMQMVSEELQRNPQAGVDELYARAKELDPSIGELSLRQFHGRYPLQAKRIAAQGRTQQRGAAKRGRARKQAGGGEEREGQTAAQRGRARKSGGRAATASQDGATSQREAIRSIFLEFASDFAGAESRPELVRVMSSVDSYVARVEKLRERAGR